MINKILSLVGLLLVLTLSGYAQRIDLSRQKLTETTVAALPASGNWAGRPYIVTDGTAGDLCGTGGSTVRTLCTWDGNSWEATGDGGTSGGAVDSVNGATGVVVLDAGDIGVTPVGSVAATNAQTAIQELDSEKLATGGTAAAATVLAANPTDCGSNVFAYQIDASGNLTCRAAVDADIPNTITIDLATAATALAANGANCSAGSVAGGVDASGAAESCIDPLTAAEQNAGTNVTADLEEETHASEHSDGGTDEVTAENLASACTDAQVLGGDGAGGVECQTDATGGGGSSINVEENNVEVIPAANLTGIDFLGVDFDVSADGNEANVLIAAAIARDSEVTSAVNAAVSGTANFLAYFNGTNSVISSSIGAAANTLTFPVLTGQIIFGDGDTYFYETSDDNLRLNVGGTDRVGFSTGTISGLATGRFSLRYNSNSCAQPTFAFTSDDDNGLCYEGTNNFGLSVGGTKRIDFTTTLQTFTTATRFNSYLDFPEIAAPANPAADFGRFFVKDDAGDTKGCFLDSAGVEVCIGDGGAAAALDDLTDVDTTGQASGDALISDGTGWAPGEVLTPDNVANVGGKTIDGGAPRTTTTTLPAGANEMPMTRHEDNCTALTGVADGVMCFEEDSNTLYIAESPEGIAGIVDSPGEWTAISGGAETNDLEATDPPTILTTEIYIGTGTGTGAFAALSGDATMSNSGVVTVANDSHTHGASTLDTDSVSADELNATGVEAELEAVLDLTDIQGTLSIAKGGTGQTAQTAAMDALSPTTTKGDLLVDNGTNVIRVAVGSNDQVLTADSAQASGVKWAAAAAGGGSTIFRAVNDTTFTCASGDNPIGEITFTAGQLAVGDVLQWEALFNGNSVTGETYLLSYQWNGDGEPLANQRGVDLDGENVQSLGSCYIASATSAICRGFDNQGTGAGMDGAAALDTRTLADITANSNTLGFSVSSCESGSTGTVYHNTIRRTR